MNKKVLATLAVVFLSVGGLAAVKLVHATPAPKVFVCKYVGTPNVNEHLQTGQNPISVSQNAIANFQGVGSYFNDAQGRSLVVAIDTGQDEPTCPVPQNPPVDESPKEPASPTTPPATTPPATKQTTPLVDVEVQLQFGK